MKLGFITDIHVGNHRQQGGPLSIGQNERCRQVLRVVTDAAQLAAQKGCTHLVVLGDVFDTPKPLPQQLAAFRNALDPFPGEVHVLVGNHDRVSSAPGDHALDPLHTANISVWDRPHWLQLDDHVRLGLCPFDERPVLVWLEEFLKTMPYDGKPTILTGHFGLYDRQAQQEQPWLAAGNDSVLIDDVAKLLKQYNVGFLYVGNYHTPAHWVIDDVALNQVGALVPTGWDNPGWHYGGLETLGLVGPAQRFEVAGPRFLVVGDGTELSAAALYAQKHGHTLYADWRCKPEEFEAASDAARHFTRGPIHVEVHVDRSYAQARAQAAAGAARSTVTLADAAVAFVGKLATIPGGVSRDRVLMHTRRFLRL